MTEFEIAPLLLDWYQIHKRPLPFRENRDAYSIYVSEIMAQQTRIETMLAYHARFLKAFPDLKSLAQADEESLHKIWQGLGYYSRVKNMAKTAQICCEKYGGKLPETKKELESLPGIGPYTAGAIASIAFSQNVAAVDGNVMRIFSRLFDIHDDLSKAAAKKTIAALVERSLPGSKSISDFNQALMDLGAMVCLPSSPNCSSCPLVSLCLAKKRGREKELPFTGTKKQRIIEKKHLYIELYKKDGNINVCMVKRPKQGLLAGLYGFREEKPQPDQIVSERKWIDSVHVFTHKEWHMSSSLVYVNRMDENFYTLQEIEEKLAVPQAFMPFVKGLKNLEKEL